MLGRTAKINPTRIPMRPTPRRTRRTITPVPMPSSCTSSSARGGEGDGDAPAAAGGDGTGDVSRPLCRQPGPGRRRRRRRFGAGSRDDLAGAGSTRQRRHAAHRLGGDGRLQRAGGQRVHVLRQRRRDVVVLLLPLRGVGVRRYATESFCFASPEQKASGEAASLSFSQLSSTCCNSVAFHPLK